MKLAVIQFSPCFGKPKENLHTIRELCGDLRADLVILPELCCTGYQFRDRSELSELAETTDGVSIRGLSKLAAACGGLVVAGFAELCGDRIFNSAALVGPKGIQGLYRKIHLFDEENHLFDNGDLGFMVFDVGSAKIGIMICFDWLFPESARSLALQGADLIAHPANLVLPYCQAAMITRALENRVYTATANRIGTEDRTAGKPLTFTGSSRIVDPYGQVILDGPPDEPQLLVADIDPALSRNKQITPKSNLLETRSPDHYRKLIES